MAIKWSEISQSEWVVSSLSKAFPEVVAWDESVVSSYIPKVWTKVVTISVGQPSSLEHERTQIARVYQFGFLLFYRCGEKEYGPVTADLPASIFSYHPGWTDGEKVGIMHVRDHGLDSDVSIVDAIRDVTPPWNYFSLNGELLELDLDGEIQPYDPDRDHDY